MRAFNKNIKMNKLITIFFFLINFCLKAQDDFKLKLSKQVCKCFNDTISLHENFDNYGKCFLREINDMPEYDSFLLKSIDTTSLISTENQAQMLGRRIAHEIQEILMKNCDSYYYQYELLRDYTINKMYKESSQSILDSLTSLIEKKGSIDDIWKRGTVNFAMGKLNKAEEDFNKCLTMNNEYIGATFFLGWVYERKKMYKKSLELYQKVYDRTLEKQIKLVIEYVKRKANL